MVVGPATPAIIDQPQETADAFLKVGVIPKPSVIHSAILSLSASRP